MSTPQRCGRILFTTLSGSTNKHEQKIRHRFYRATHYRVTYEDAYVAVPVTDAITKQNEDGSAGIDTEAFFAEAIRISNDPRVEWKLEACETEPHPTQAPMPEDRQSFEEFYPTNF